MADKPANLSNWRTRPYSAWAFRNVEKFIRTVRIDANKEASQDLPSSPFSLDDFKVSTQDGTSLSLEDYLKATSTDSFLVLKDGKVVYEFYDNGNTSESLHILMSVTKSIIGLLLGIVSERSEIDVDALVSKYIPEIAGTAYDGTTIRQLIDMRTGVQADMWDPGYRAAMAWEPRSDEAAKQPNGLLEYFSTLKVETKPHGGAFHYISQNTDLLGLAIERATGKSLCDLLADLFWKPLGAQHDAIMTVDPAGAARAAGGMCTTLRDFARIGQLMLDGGKSGSNQVVPSEWIDDILTKGDPEAWKQGSFAKAMARAGRELNYRSGWYIARGEPALVSANGIHGQQLFVDLTNRLVVAKTSSQMDQLDLKYLVLMYPVISEIRRLTT